MATLKDKVNQAMTGLPADAKVDDLMYRLYVLDRIEKAEAEADHGETMSLNQLRKEVKQWR